MKEDSQQNQRSQEEPNQKIIWHTSILRAYLAKAESGQSLRTMNQVVQNSLHSFQTLLVRACGHEVHLDAGVKGHHSSAPPCPSWSIGVGGRVGVQVWNIAKVLGDSGFVKTRQILQPLLNVCINLSLKTMDFCKRSSFRSSKNQSRPC